MPTMNPTVSVIIPTFNRAPLLTRAVQSVLAQTWKNYELIVIDDGSVDNTREILKPYRERLLYYYQQNRGISAAQNKGIEFAKGEWISILASDDEWFPAKLERQLQAIGELGGDFDACFTDCRFMGDPSLRQTAFELGGLEKGRPIGILDRPLHYVLARHPVVWVQSLLVRRSLMNELGGFDEAMTVAEDTDLLFRLALKTRFCFVAEALVKIDRTPSRSTGLTELFYEGHDKAFSSQEYMCKKWLSLPGMVDPATRGQVRELLRNLYYDWTIRKLYQFRFSEAFGKMRQVRQAGDSSPQILSTLAFRAARKLSRSLTPQSHPA